MPTVAEIIAWAKRKKSTSESDSDLVIDLNGIQDEIYIELNSYREAFGYLKTYDILSVSGQLNYDLPLDCPYEDIDSVQVSQASNSIYFDKYVYAGLLDVSKPGMYWSKGSNDGEIALIKDGLPIQLDGLSVCVFYKPSPIDITTTTQTPNLDERYHNLYKYALVQSIASQGDNPDTEIADYYQIKYNELMAKIKSEISDKATTNPVQISQAKEGW